MATTPRFEGQQIVNSINLFVDTERASIVGDTQSRGDDVHYGFEGNTQLRESHPEPFPLAVCC